MEISEQGIDNFKPIPGVMKISVSAEKGCTFPSLVAAASNSRSAVVPMAMTRPE